ncbi:sce7726 family protein [Lysobacter maris]|uniref:Sce7726 family protein n=1 Tax=Marilutibacter maris TaxID=1605891 RepID=A0A508AU48_9GAMM|nr:sce7726 family protein [Lysobacter maris]KAB8193908.1 sce7726 family protein [Lysobacter maris]
MREEQIKISVVRWLLSQLESSEVIATELHFNNWQNRADIVVSSPNRLAAYEIKSSYDDFRRYSQQKEAYQAAFLESYLVIPHAMLEIAREHLDRTTGVLTVDEFGIITRRRKSLVRTRLGKDDALGWLRVPDARKIQRSLGPALNIKELKAPLATKVALEIVHERLRVRYDIFNRERGRVLTTDDLAILSSPTSVR